MTYFKKVSERDIHYYCNGAGDVFWHDDAGNCIDVDAVDGVEDEHIPAPLRRAYNECWTDEEGYPAYIAEIEGKPFLFLCDEWFDCEKERENDVQKSYLCQLNTLLDFIKRLLGCKELDGCTVFFPEDSGTPFCQWEFMVAMPAETVTKK